LDVPARSGCAEHHEVITADIADGADTFEE
jgi:hypothetical protein